jgi:uncharacterized membrane protein YvbJ
VNTLCPSCKKEIETTDNFCPHCGHTIHQQDLVLTTNQKIKIYAFSIFLTPLGVIPFFRHFRSAKPENRKTAYIALVVTVIPFIFMTVVISKYLNSLSSIIDVYETNLDVYTELGL